jgi:AraC family transcriptional regulator
MSLMQAWKYPRSTLLKSSKELGWSALSAELRSHGRGEGPGTAAPQVEVAVTVQGSDEGIVTCNISGRWQLVRPTTGSIWLKPTGASSDESRVESPKLRVMHLYVPTTTFARLMEDYDVPARPDRSIRYSCGVQDELINQIGLSMLTEMMYPSAVARMLVEASSLLLAARLMRAHAETEPARVLIQAGHRLDDRKLRRVLAYVEEHLTGDLTVAELASVACLSIFHFTRAFAAAMGMPPHRYVSERRLERAKATIAAGRASLSEIALDCQFSSQSSFTRAFRRATGVTPAEYRRTLR